VLVLFITLVAHHTASELPRKYSNNYKLRRQKHL